MGRRRSSSFSELARISIFSSHATKASHSFAVVQDFSAAILIPILRNLIEEVGKGAVKEGSGDLGTEGAADTDCSQCGEQFNCQGSLREHIDDLHVAPESGKRKRFNSEGSAQKPAVIPDGDLIAQMSNAIRILNDKREAQEEKANLDREVIDKLGTNLEA